MAFLKDGKKNECCGCSACASICPSGCISMKEDEEGFLYPQVDKDKCISCGLCEKACPEGYKDFYKPEGIEAYIAVNKDRTVVEKSTSGGVFSALCRQLTDRGYTVYGAAMDEKLKVRHIPAYDIEGCGKFRKSKYVQSDMSSCFADIEMQLKKDKKISFSGLPCQCAALKKYLKLKRCRCEDLLLISVLCRGVPPQKLFDGYISETEKKYGKKISSYEFRNKSEGCGKGDIRSARMIFDDGSEKILFKEEDPYLKGYYKRLFLRPSCGVCGFARRERVADITLSDHWGLEGECEGLDVSKGASLIMAVTDKGKELVNDVKEELTLIAIDKDKALSAQTITSKPVYMHENRDRFFSMLKKKSFYEAVEKNVRPPLQRIVRILLQEGKKHFFAGGKAKGGRK